MSQRQLTRFRFWRTARHPRAYRENRHARFGLLTALSALLFVGAVLVLSITLWTETYLAESGARWESRYQQDAQKAVKAFGFNAPWKVPPFERGDESQVQVFLDKHPLVAYLATRNGPFLVWERKGDHLELLPSSPQKTRLERLAVLAVLEGQNQWVPPLEMDPGQDSIATQIFLDDEWIRIDQIQPGSPSLEHYFQRELGADYPLRIGIFSKDMLKANHTKPAEWGAEPNTLVDFARAKESPVAISLVSSAFPASWKIAFLPREAIQKDILHGIWMRRLTGASCACLIIGTFALALRIRHQAMLKAQLKSDHLAALAHSLKTPLAIHKLRCDAIRLNMMPPEDIPGELIRLGVEVDQFTQIIEQGLMPMHEGQPSPMTRVPPEWFESLAEDLVPAFEREQRTLRLLLTGEHGRASLPTLRVGVLTLLENALSHGLGTVTLETIRQGRRFLVVVKDEGPGLDTVQLKAIGKPFMRIRRPGSEGFRVQGHGLGLSLLIQMARGEGWGFSMSSAPGKGLTATLTIHAHPEQA